MSTDTDNNVALFLESIHALSNTQDCAAVYDKWSETYDIDVRHEDVDYVGPSETAQAVMTAGGNITGVILDAGCGTGLVGVALVQAGAKQIDGIDISAGMLAVARKTGVYRNLVIADMTKPIDKPDESYDVITCCGTFTESHVGPSPALKEFVRIVKKGGFVVATITEVVWVSGGYKAEVERLAMQRAVTIVTKEIAEYRRGTNMMAYIVVLQRNLDHS